MSQDQITQSTNMANGELYEANYKYMEDLLAKEDFVGWDLNDYDGAYSGLLKEAL
jgi:hypothetical protein